MIEARFYPIPAIEFPHYTIVKLPFNDDDLLTAVRRTLGGRFDMGSARPNQYAVGEWSLVDSSEFNDAASILLGRQIAGPCIVWGVGPDGSSVDYIGGDDE